MWEGGGGQKRRYHEKKNESTPKRTDVYRRRVGDGGMRELRSIFEGNLLIPSTAKRHPLERQQGVRHREWHNGMRATRLTRCNGASLETKGGGVGGRKKAPL